MPSFSTRSARRLVHKVITAVLGAMPVDGAAGPASAGESTVQTALLASAAVEPSASPSVFQNFITRQADKLMDGDREFRFMGANMPGLIMPYDFTMGLPERTVLPSPWEQEDGIRTLDQMNARCVRLWNLPIRGPGEGEEAAWKHVQAPGRFNERSFETIDCVLALANKYGIRVVLPLSADSGDFLGGIATYAAWHGKQRKDFYTDAEIKEDYKATLAYVLNRTNRLTGIRYKEDKAILCWQFANEMDEAPPPEPWHAELAAFLKSIDSNHLVMYGRQYIPAEPDPNIDIVTCHYYYDRDWVQQCIAHRQAARGKRPFVIGEFGPYVGTSADADKVVQNCRRFLDQVIADGVSGAMIWSMYFHHRNGGFWWHQIMTYPSVWSYHWPGFDSGQPHRERDVLAVLREAAYRIQGLPVPPLPLPGVPELLPVGDAPLLSWRGATGASGYDIQRASQPDGPWCGIATNVSDADVAYRPLFNDVTAPVGQPCFYRVIARNSSGTSPSSNVVGPVVYRRRCLVDELKDLSLVREKSGNLTLGNDFNALYAEYLYRLRGERGAWVTYQVTGAMSSFKVVAWFAGEPEHLAFAGSKDGQSYDDILAEHSDRCLGSPQVGPARKEKRIHVEYTGVPREDCRFLKILWRGPSELDRVEICH